MNDEIYAIAASDLEELGDMVHAGHAPEPKHCCSEPTCKKIMAMLHDSPLYENTGGDE